MSSSKVYDSSNGFQPEQIVSTSKKRNKGWEPSTENAQEKKPYTPGLAYKKLSEDELEQKNRRSSDKVAPESLDTDKTEKNLPPIEVANNSAPLEEQKDVNKNEIINKPVTQVKPQVEQINTVSIKESEKAVEKAFQSGVLEGRKQAGLDYQSSASTLLSVAEQLNTTRETLIENAIGEMQDLVITIAEKIIGHSVTAQDDTILSTVEEAIRQAVKSDEFLVCINQEDYNIINKKASELIAGLSGLKNIVIRIDNSIERGGCKIESDFCTVDATISSQLKLITEQVKSRR